MTFAIQAEQLGKSYLIGHRRREPYQTLRESLTQGVRSAWNRLRHPNLSAGGDDIEEFWALRDVSFAIQPGDRVGIIGRNGAGKSTLLKILSRITEPTTGRFVTRGRVASLLEVGTGFHPELSGRENIYLNGAILGMTRNDVKRQFDAIVDFAGVEKFLDTPVKRYSSGMYVRLAFAVAAHLEPDILIVDEVLAVGDAEFQKKCLGKMEEVGKEGRTVVFVSHNMGAIRRLCDKGMVVDGGRVNGVVGVESCITEYHSESRLKRLNAPSNKVITFQDFKSTYNQGRLYIDFNVLINADIDSVLAIKLTDYNGNDLVTVFDTDNKTESFHKKIGNYNYNVNIDVSHLCLGTYSITLSASDLLSQRFDYIENIATFEQTDVPCFIDLRHPERQTILFAQSSWTCNDSF